MSEDFSFDGLDDTATEAATGSLSEPMRARVQAGVDRRLSAEVDAIAAAQFEELLTPELHHQLAEATRARMEAELDAAIDAAGNEPEPLKFGSVEEFVRDHLAVLYRREVEDVPHRCWCPQWWRHAEAVARLEALWRSFEHLRKDPHTGMSVWLRDHADHHMEKLFASDGPFQNCDTRTGHSDRLHPLPVDPAPPAMFPDQRQR
ncbi:DUF4913 domain-containing protein [Rhodococcus sp. 14-1411-2a]|uniref:DUF4913 domain-containing protein n=1 Tax=Rhodococcus sp. 14-1411-2a TaxID=2023151 RepID=UPI00211AD52F|nr:DUF4913 domain-containing protein [Rhodococcus sp. 14-1411-2a]